MESRIELILKTKNMTPSQLADRIGVQRSSVSHILARRNKPSLDFVQKVLRAFPEIRSQWLLFGEGVMFDALSKEASLSPMSSIPANDTFNNSHESDTFPLAKEAFKGLSSSAYEANAESAFDFDLMSDKDEYQHSNEVEHPIKTTGLGIESDTIPINRETIQAKKSVPDMRTLEKIVFFYSDGRFRIYLPN